MDVALLVSINILLQMVSHLFFCRSSSYTAVPSGDDEPFTKVESSALSIASVTVNPVPAVATQTAAVGPTPQTVTGPETVPATQGIPFTPTVPTAPVPVMGPSALVPPTQAGAAGTSTSTRWYVVTVGRETGVFQGWYVPYDLASSNF